MWSGQIPCKTQMAKTNTRNVEIGIVLLLLGFPRPQARFDLLYDIGAGICKPLSFARQHRDIAGALQGRGAFHPCARVLFLPAPVVCGHWRHLVHSMLHPSQEGWDKQWYLQVKQEKQLYFNVCATNNWKRKFKKSFTTALKNHKIFNDKFKIHAKLGLYRKLQKWLKVWKA